MTSPVFGAGSREITNLIHRVQNVTALVRARTSSQEDLRVNREQLVALRSMKARLLQRRREGGAPLAHLSKEQRQAAVRLLRVHR